MFFFSESCFQRIGQHLHAQICVGASVILWPIWLWRNEIIFGKKKIPFLFTGRFQGNLLDKVMARLQNKENGQILKWACRILETFANHGWPSFKRISFI
jgi:hypothetical protein